MGKTVSVALLALCACVPTEDGLTDPSFGAHAAVDDMEVNIDFRRVSRLLLESHTVSGITQSQVVADFHDEFPAPISVAVTWEGSCRISHIELLTENVVREFYDIGPLRVVGGLREVSLDASHESGLTGYPAQSSDSLLFLGGEMLNVSTWRPGTATLQTDLVAPEAVVMTNPLYPLDNKLMVNRYHPLDISWTGSSAGELVVQLSAITKPGASSVEVECFFPAEDEWGSISPWVFQEIPQDATMKLSAEVRSTAILELPRWGDIEVRASTRALVPSGEMYAASMAFWPLPDF